LRLQSDERLVAVVRRGNVAAFELLVSRYEVRLLSFCRHLLRSREDAEDVLQEVMAAAYNAMLSDERPINVRPWLYRIARNRCLNHLRKAQAIGVDSMDVHFSDNGASTADKVHDREQFRQLVGDIHGLPETQRTALVLREMDALSYEQIAEAMDTTVPSVKSLLVRARVSLAEASEARLLTCEEVRDELGEAAEGLIKKPSPAVRRHVKSCSHCGRFEKEIRHSSRALSAALVPIGAAGMLRKVLLVHFLGHSAGSGAAGAAGAGATGGGTVAGAAGVGAGAAGVGAGAAGVGAGAAGVGAGAAGAGAAASAAGGASSAGLISAGVGAVATKAAAGLAAAALVTAGTVAVSHGTHRHAHQPTGLQVLTSAVSVGVAHSNAIAPRLAAPVRAVPAAKQARTGRTATRAPKPTDAARKATAASPAHKRLGAPAAATTGSAGPVSTTPVTPAGATTPTATVASGDTTTLSTVAPTTTVGSTTTPTGTTTSPSAETATSTTATPPSTDPAETSTTPTSNTPTSTTPTGTTSITSTTTTSPTTGGAGIVPGQPVTTVVSTTPPAPSS
jgi:RNA polymerase sigma factor (sigma-70 family)